MKSMIATHQKQQYVSEAMEDQFGDMIDDLRFKITNVWKIFSRF